MLSRAFKVRLGHVRALSGAAPRFAGAPPGYNNIFLPDSEMPQPLPEGGMTPQLRARLAAKYNMRPEDYKPCAWSDEWTTQTYGDYPLLDFENAASRNKTYDWDDRHFRRNHGDILHHDHMFALAGYPGTSDRQNVGPVWDLYRSFRFYSLFMLATMCVVVIDMYLSRVKNVNQMMPNRFKEDAWGSPWVQWNYGLYNTQGDHRYQFRHMGLTTNKEDDKFERWGTREQVNRTIPGWEDLDKVPDYLHVY